jgi:hypothetical protein
MARVSQYGLQSRPFWYAYDFLFYHRISVEGLEDEIRQLTVDIKKLDCQLNEDKNGIRSYFKGIVYLPIVNLSPFSQNVT